MVLLVMKKILILLILSVFLLSGCGIYNLNFFVLPDDAEFLALIQELDTPEKIGDYMLDNFEYEPHPYILLTPYQLYITKKGDCDDFANFARFIAHYHGYETFLIKISYNNYAFNHYLAIYKENGLYNFSDNQHYFLVNYNNFYDIVLLDSQWVYDRYGYIWTKYTVYDYNNNIVEQVTK